MMDNRMVFGSADVAKWYIQQRIWKHAHELVPTLCAQRKLRRWRAADSSLPDTIRFP